MGSGRERSAQFERCAANAQQITGWRLSVLQLDIDLHDGFRGERMGTDAGIAHGGKPVDCEWWFGLQAGIDEEDEAPFLQIERVFHLQLEIGQALDTGQAQRSDALDEERAKCIVATRRVAPAENQNRRGHGRLQVPRMSRTMRSSAVPPAPTISTSSGILPSACVAQDRQGSKQRIATSM